MKPGRNDPCVCGSGKKYKNCCLGKVELHPSSLLAPSPAELNQLGILFNIGRHAELESRTRALLEQYPDVGVVWKLFGLSLQMQGKEALAALQKAAELLPGDAEAHANLAGALRALGHLDEAAASGRRAVQIKPDFAEAHNNLGVVLKDLGQLDEAVASYRRALQIKPDFAEAYNNLGGALKELGQLDEAVASYRRALQIKLDFAEAHNNLAGVLRVLGQLDSAVKSGRRAVQIKPDFAEAYNNLGVTLQDLGQFDEAVASYRRALQIKPDFAEAHNNLGVALQDLGQFDEAVTSYRRALQIKPDFAEAHNNLGGALREFGQLDEAAANYRRALEIKPDFAEARSNLLLVLNYTSHSPSSYLAEARQYGLMVAGKVASRFTAWQCEASPKRLRVGVVSGDLREHSVGHFLEGLLAQIDPARIELIGYPTNHLEDALSARIKPHFAAWKPLFNLNDQAAAQLIHADGVHVLIDLSGHTAHNRLPVFAWKPAPVQFTWIGLPATTGLAEMDYVLGDPVAIPVEDEEHFAEKVWRLPESYLCFTPPDVALAVSPLPALTAGLVTFASFNNLAKMSDATAAVWARVLQAVPGSRLFLKTKQLQDATVLEATVQRFAAHGIDKDRLILEGWASQRADHLAGYQRVDIALDTFPYPGVTTSVEALWMGVPVITLQGDRFLSRTAESIAHHAGLPDWIAADEDDYVAKAVLHLVNLERLATLRAGLRQQVLATPLFNVPRFARNVEEALWGMWNSRQA